MKINNKTKWQTKQLRALINEVMKRSPSHLKDKFKEQQYRAKLEVEVVYNKQKHRGSCSGRGWYNSWSIRLMLPSQQVDRIDLAMVIAHELAHTLNYRHPDMTGSALFNRIGSWREIYAWAENFPLEHEPVKLKPKGTDLQLLRYNRILTRQTAWELKLKRAQNALKKINKDRRYYEKRLAAKGVEIGQD